MLETLISQVNAGFRRRSTKGGMDPTAQKKDKTEDPEQPPEWLEWTSRLPLAAMLSDAIPKEEGKSPFHLLSTLSPDAVKNVACAFRHGLEKLLLEECDLLKRALDASVTEMPHLNAGMCLLTPTKFETNMICGHIDDFYNGISGLVGHPCLHFAEAMKSEHCTKAGHDFEFENPLNGQRTNAAREWAITVDSLDVKRKGGRVKIDITRLLQCDLSKQANLGWCELVAVVLYTGPMFVVYNSMLRKSPEKIYAIFKKGDNLFSTTICLLVSAVQKLTRIQNIHEGLKIYRGLAGGLDLPPSFLVADAQGCRGFVELAFLSTTADWGTAVSYSVRNGIFPATVLEAEIGAVARGANIREFSQYPKEKEYLFPPCSFVEPAGVPRLEITPKGVLRVIPVKLFPNVGTSTVEGLLGQKKRMHITSFKFIITQLEQDLKVAAEQGGLADRIKKDITKDLVLKHTPELFLENIKRQSVNFLTQACDKKNEEFVDDFKYRAIVTEMLDAKTMAMAKLELYIKDQTILIESFHNIELREAFRALVAYSYKSLAADAGNRKTAALELCRLQGLQCDVINELGEPTIVSAAGDGLNPKILKLLVETGAGLADADSKGQTALHLSACYGHAENLQTLLEMSAEANCSEQGGETPLFKAVQNGHLECVRLLLRSKANANHKNQGGTSPLDRAATYGRAEGIRALVEALADVNTARDVRFPFPSTPHSGCPAPVDFDITLTEATVMGAEADICVRMSNIPALHTCGLGFSEPIPTSHEV